MTLGTAGDHLNHVETDQNLSDAIDLQQNVIFFPIKFLNFFRGEKTVKAYVRKR